MPLQRIRLDAIAFDAGTQVRAAISEEVVADYADKMTENVAFPAIVLFHDGSQYFLADGFHRYMAAKRNAFVDIEATVQPGTKADALWFALGANRANGSRMTDADKRHAVVVAVQTFANSKSQKEIAKQIGCSQGWISLVISRNNLERPERITGADGRSYPSSIDARQQARTKAAEMLKAGKTVDEVRAESGVGRETVYEIKREIGAAGADKSKTAVTQRRQDIRDMAGRGFSTPQIAATIGIGEAGISRIAKAEGIVIHADRVVGKTRRIDANRIVSQMVLQLESLTADLGLVDFGALDADSLPVWIAAIKGAQKSIGAFVRRLEQEQKQHVEAAAAQPSRVEGSSGDDLGNADASGGHHPAEV